jgi:hypothetical protein
MNRMQGVHVTPTVNIRPQQSQVHAQYFEQILQVVFDGVVENNISSSFSGEQWEEWLKKNIA